MLFPHHFNSLPGSPLSSHTVQINHRAQHVAGLQSIAAVENAAAHLCRAGAFAEHLLWPETVPSLQAECVILTTTRGVGTTVQTRAPRFRGMGSLASHTACQWQTETWGQRPGSFQSSLLVPSFELRKPGGSHSVLDLGILAVCTHTCYLRPLFSDCHIYQLTLGTQRNASKKT